MLRLVKVLVLVVVAVCAQAADYPMRDRVFCDEESRTAFRFPYHYRIVDQYAGVLRDIGDEMYRSRAAEPTMEVIINGQRVQVQAPQQNAPTPRDTVVHFTITADELPSDVDPSDLAAIAAHVADGAIEFSEWDYYQRPEERPHAGPKWVPEGIVAGTWSGDGDSGGLIVAHDDRWSGLVLAGNPGSGDFPAIIDSFEVLSNKNARRNREVMTWRESQFRAGKLIGANNQIFDSRRGGTVDWANAWEIETKHYHITTTVEPRRAIFFGAYMEALYEAFVGVYQPDSIPPYKMEVHIETDVRAFISFASSLGINGLSDGSNGQLTGGFFVPSLLALVSFNEPVPDYPTRVERVLSHEASHQFLHVTCNGSSHVPTWINEGLAVYFESGTFRGNSFRWGPPKGRVEQLRQAYGQTGRTLWPLEQYLDHRGGIAASQYGEVYAMTHFFVFGSQRGRELFQQYWQALREGEDGAAKFEEIFMSDLISAHGSRSAAVRVWEQALLRYVQAGEPLKGSSR